jgi:CO dehydrogenase nickel-insertion accessory protein CooC1
MKDRAMTLRGRKIGLIGKGGAGKSTCITLLAQAMRQRGHAVCVLDTDSTNLGLHAALGIDRPPRSLIDHFGGMVFQGGKVTCPADDPTVLADPIVDLESLPGRYVAESDAGVVLLTVGKLSDFGVGAGCDGPMVKIARDLVVRRGGEPMTMLVDLKAGIEDTSRGVITGMSDVIVVCDPSAAALGIAQAMKRVVEDLHRGAEPATAHIESAAMAELARQLFRQSRLKRVEVILNNVPDPQTATYMTRKLARLDMEPIAVLHESPALRQAWLRGEPLPCDGLSDALAGVVTRMEAGAAVTEATSP